MATLAAFGDISIDIPVRVSHLPAADEKIWATTIGEFPGGMAANTASAFAALGGHAVLVAGVGSDERGQASINDLLSRGVDTQSVHMVDGPTFWTLALLDESGEKALVMFATPALRVPWQSLDYSRFEGIDAAHFVAEEGPEVVAAMRFCRSRGITTSVDVEETALGGSDLMAIVQLADVVFCGGETVLRELDSQFGGQGAGRGVIEAGATVVVTTLGKDGCVVASRRRPVFTIAGLSVEAVDTTGAGDCFAGAFLFGLTSGWDHRASAELATLMAAMSVTAYGSRGRLLGLADLLALPEAAQLSSLGGRAPHG